MIRLFWGDIMQFNIIRAVASGCLCALAAICSMSYANTVTVSNYPLLLLSNAVTQGQHPAKMLLSAGDVGHHGSLEPSGVKLVHDSKFVVWFGKELEQNLVNTLQHAPNAISLYQFDTFRRLPLREVDGTSKDKTFDPHLWLEPDNAKAIVMALAVIHGYANPQYKAVYLQNAKQFAKRMDEVVSQLPSHQPLKYWAYHDAYQYLERSAKLSFAGALTPDHHLNPKASQLKWLNTHRPNAHMCLVSQGKVSDGIVNKLGGVAVVVKQEDMSDGQEFIQVWQALVEDIYRCGASK